MVTPLNKWWCSGYSVKLCSGYPVNDVSRTLFRYIYLLKTIINTSSGLLLGIALCQFVWTVFSVIRCKLKGTQCCLRRIIIINVLFSVIQWILLKFYPDPTPVVLVSCLWWCCRLVYCQFYPVDKQLINSGRTEIAHLTPLITYRVYQFMHYFFPFLLMYWLVSLFSDREFVVCTSFLKCFGRARPTTPRSGVPLIRCS